MAFSKAHPDIALEPDVIATGELEGVETGQQALRVRIVIPFSEDRGICSASILISHDVLVLHHILHGLGHATPRESSVDRSGLHLDLEHETISDFGGVDLLPRGRDDLHQAGWWRTCVGYGASCRQHGHVEA